MKKSDSESASWGTQGDNVTRIPIPYGPRYRSSSVKDAKCAELRSVLEMSHLRFVYFNVQV